MLLLRKHTNLSSNHDLFSKSKQEFLLPKHMCDRFRMLTTCLKQRPYMSLSLVLCNVIYVILETVICVLLGVIDDQPTLLFQYEDVSHFSGPKAMFLNHLFCSTNSPKHKDSLTIWYRRNQQINMFTCSVTDVCVLSCLWVVFCCQQLTGGQTWLLISDLLPCMCVWQRDRQRPSLLLSYVSSIPADPGKTVTPRKWATGCLT